MRFLLSLFLLTASALAEIIPAGNRVTWTPWVTVGVPGGIPNRTTIYTNFVTAGADNTGNTNCATLLASLYASCPSNQVIYVPAGYYLLTNAVSLGLKSGVVIRGAGMTNTTFINSIPGSGAGIFGLGAWAPWAPTTKDLTLDAAKGSSNLIVADTTGLTVGRLIRISSLNRTNAPRVIHVAGFERALRQLCEITALTGGTNITVWPPLYWDHPVSLGARVEGNAYSTEMAGFEDFGVTATNHLTGFVGKGGSGWILAGVKSVWWTNVKYHYAHSFHFNLNQVLYPEVRGCEFRESQSAGANTGQILMAGDVCAGLFENNIHYRGGPAIEVNFASSGNVFGYNYSYDARSGGLILGLDFDANHGPHPMMNLWEGNIGALFTSDGYFGSSSHNTTFRNWFQAAHPTLTNFAWWRGVALCRWTTYYNFVGNVLGSPGHSYTYFNWATNDFSGHSSSIYQNGYPNTGSLGYRGFSPDTWSWNYPASTAAPGTNNLMAVVGADSIATTNFTGADFTKVKAGNFLVFQSRGADTNYYYPRGAVVAYANGTATNLFLTAANTITNGDAIYFAGASSYMQMQLDDAATHLHHGNYDYYNNAVLWDGSIMDTNLVASMYLPSKPAWMGTYPFPAIGPDLLPVNPTNAIPSQGRFWSSDPPAGGGGVATEPLGRGKGRKR